MRNLQKFRQLGLKLATLAVLCVAIVGCQESRHSLTPQEMATMRHKLASILANPQSRSKLVAKIMGSTVEGERHTFLKFHIFGFAGDGNLIPFFSMNNYIIQKWVPGKDATYNVQYYEVGYYTKFDTDEAISEWENPLTGETIQLPHLVLGPLHRSYGPGIGTGAASFAPSPINIAMIGDRVYVPTLTRVKNDNMLRPEEWGPYSSGPVTYWDSMLVFSADIRDVLDNQKTHVPAEIHMQNLVSWAPYLKLGKSAGRTMVRAYGQHISGFDDLPENVRADLRKYTPQIFDVNSWTEMKFDSVEFANSLMKKRNNGTLDIDQPDYVAPAIRKVEEFPE